MDWVVWWSMRACNIDPSACTVRLRVHTPMEYRAATDLLGDGAQAEMGVMGSGCKHGWSLACLSAACLVLSHLVSNRPQTRYWEPCLTGYSSTQIYQTLSAVLTSVEGFASNRCTHSTNGVLHLSTQETEFQSMNKRILSMGAAPVSCSCALLRTSLVE